MFWCVDNAPPTLTASIPVDATAATDGVAPTILARPPGVQDSLPIPVETESAPEHTGDTDVEPVPTVAIDDAPNETEYSHTTRVVVEGVASFATLRPSADQTNVGMRLVAKRASIDIAGNYVMSDQITFTFSDRLDFMETRLDGQLVDNRVQSYLREASVSWEAWPQTYFEIGRVNLRLGPSLSVNPTDFFKSGSSTNQVSLDPSSVRDARMGTVMLRFQRFWGSGSLDLSYAPALVDAPAELGSPPEGLGLSLTNNENRVLLTMTQEIAGITPQLSIYVGEDRLIYGVSASKLLSPSTLLYFEWAGGDQPTIITDAANYARRTGATDLSLGLSAAAPSYQASNDLTAGISWASAAWKLSVNVEAHHQDRGVNQEILLRWARSRSVGAGLEKYLQAYSTMAGTPFGINHLFVRSSVRDLPVRNSEISMFTLMNLDDRSALWQLSATFNWKANWDIGLYFSATSGARGTEYGGFGIDDNASIRLARYF